MRGAHFQDVSRRFCFRRFIPTCVGHTQAQSVSGSSVPRFIPTCVGHTCSGSSVSLLIHGSSPRAWGILSRAIISPILFSVHPHVRGAYNLAIAITKSGCAVHPHVRGAYLLPINIRLFYFRFIPTCVGHTDYIDMGVNKEIRFIPTCVGHTLPCFPFPPRQPWFIPTCVGHTVVWQAYLKRHGGSSPRAWGIHLYSHSGQFLLRFIPTCVGHTVTIRI